MVGLRIKIPTDGLSLQTSLAGFKPTLKGFLAAISSYFCYHYLMQIHTITEKVSK
jgi:hypothetical protein